MSKVTMTATVGVREVKEYLTALFHKPGIVLAQINFLGLNPLPETSNDKFEPKCVYISLGIKVPFGSTVEVSDNQEDTFPEPHQD